MGKLVVRSSACDKRVALIEWYEGRFFVERRWKLYAVTDREGPRILCVARGSAMKQTPWSRPLYPRLAAQLGLELDGLWKKNVVLFVDVLVEIALQLLETLH